MIHIVLPAHNEAENIGALLENIKTVMQVSNLQYHVIVVNDGSRDQTRSIAESFSKHMPIDIIDNEEQSGLAKTLKRGLVAAAHKSSEQDVIITMDADNTQNPGLIPRMIQRINEGCDVVIASRYRQESRVIGLSVYRRIFSYLASVLFRIFFPIQGVKDFTCGYRAYRADTLKQAFNTYADNFIDQPGFSCMVDILLKIRRFPIIMCEAPLILRYDYKKGASKMRIMRTIWETLLLIVKRRFMGSFGR